MTSFGELLTMLSTRGVNDPHGVLRGLSEETIDVAPSVIAWWDSQPNLGVGMLINSVRSGHVPGSVQEKRPPVTERLLRSVRGSCESPDGFTREEARGLFAHAAKRRALEPDELIDRAMGPAWKGTIVRNPAKRDLPLASRIREYADWVAGPKVAA